MTNFLISIIIAISLLSLTGWGALELFQGARDSYDQQMLSLRLEQVGAAVKSNIRMIDGLPALPAPPISGSATTGTYPTVPTWISANAIDTNGHQFVYCPYALRPTTNLESTSGATTTVTGPGYNILTYSSSLFGTNSPSYVVGSDKPALYATAPAGTLTPGNTSGYGVTFTISGGTFSASNIGQMLQSGAGTAIITGYTNSTHVVATITQAFPSTSAIASGSWKLSSVTPKGLLGFIIAFKPHDTYSAATAASWCNGQIQMTESGGYTTVGSSVNGLVYPIIVGQSLYQQAYAKTDNVTYYAAPSASGDGTGRNISNQATLQSIMAQLAALRPARAYIYLASGTHSVTIKNYDQAYEPNNLRGITVTLDGGTNSPTISLTRYVGSSVTNSIFNWPVNLILKNLTLSRTDTTTSIQPSTDIKWVFDGVTDNVPTYVYNNLWVRSTTNTSTFGNILQVARNGKLYINGNTMVSTAYAGYFQIISGEVNIMPGASLIYAASTNSWSNGYNNPVLTVGTGSTLNISGTGSGTPSLTITTASGKQMNAALGVEAGGTINMNNATLNICSGTGATIGGAVIFSNVLACSTGTPTTVAGVTGRSAKGAIFVSGEMNINNSAILFPSGVSTSVAAVDLVDGGRFTMHNGSAIGSNSTVAQRPYYGVYDDGGTFVGGSSTGYSSGANGEGGSAQSNVYVQNSAGAMCWSGYPWPTSPASGSAAQQRHLFWDSPEGNGQVSTPRGTNMNTFSTYFTTTNASIITGLQTFTVNSATGIAVGSQVSIVSTSSAASYMVGYVTAISGTSITVNVTGIGGSGTITAGSGNNTFAGGLDMRHLILANQTNWACTNPTTTTTPTSPTASVSFANQTAWCGASSYTSETILPTGYNSAATIAVNNGGSSGSPQYSLSGGTFTSSSGTISPGNTLTLKATPSATNNGTITPTVTIGSTTASWTITSKTSCYGINPVNGNQATGGGASTTSISATFPSATTMNDLVVVTVAATANNTPTLSDNKSTTYTAIASGGANGVYLWSFYAKQVQAGITAITATFSSATSAVMIVTEYPITNSAPLDQSSSINAGSSTSPSVTPTQAIESVIGYNAAYATSGTASIAALYPSAHFVTVSTGGLTLGQSDTAASTIASQTASYTDTGTGVVADTGIMTFKSP